VSILKFIWKFLSVEVIGINDLQTNGIERKQFLQVNIIKTRFYFTGSAWNAAEPTELWR